MLSDSVAIGWREIAGNSAVDEDGVIKPNMGSCTADGLLEEGAGDGGAVKGAGL